MVFTFSSHHPNLEYSGNTLGMNELHKEKVDRICLQNIFDVTNNTIFYSHWQFVVLLQWHHCLPLIAIFYSLNAFEMKMSNAVTHLVLAFLFGIFEQYDAPISPSFSGSNDILM